MFKTLFTLVFIYLVFGVVISLFVGDAALGFSITFFIGIYFFPYLVATSRNHPQDASILVLNLFLGWTLLGWVVALIWAVSAI